MAHAGGRGGGDHSAIGSAGGRRCVGSGRNAVSLRVLVLGADGFIGGQLVAALAAGYWATPIAAGFSTST